MPSADHLRLMKITKRNLSNDPGVKLGVSPTLRLLDFFAFLSKYFFARAYNFVLYSFSIAPRSR